HKAPKLAWHSRVAFASMASKTGCNLPCEPEMTSSTSDVAVCCSSASARCSRASTSSCLYFSSCCSRSARGFRPLPPPLLAFVPSGRSLRPCVWLFAPLRDKVTTTTGRSTQALLATDHLKHNTAGSAVGEAAYVGATDGNGAGGAARRCGCTNRFAGG